MPKSLIIFDDADYGRASNLHERMLSCKKAVLESYRRWVSNEGKNAEDVEVIPSESMVVWTHDDGTQQGTCSFTLTITYTITDQTR